MVKLGDPWRFSFRKYLYSEKDKSFMFLDWRQDFAGYLSIGDVYYDLAKLMHGLIVITE